MGKLVAGDDPDRDFDELTERAEAHPGRTAAQRWAMWRTVVDIYDANERELLKTLAPADLSAEKAMDLIRSVGPQRRDRPDYFIEVYRLLHNYLASVKTLVDHSRVLMQGYPESSPIRTEYEARAAAVGQISSVKFIQELRNVVLHAELPELISTVRWDAGDDKAHHILALDREALLAKGGWAKQARLFIEDQRRPSRSGRRSTTTGQRS
ncbi:hypothetical protein AB0L70_13335 [Kribbella sp. NPDC051952]|uniref:hypothetical protein n=1 Tax=Kribbella sp. NPDC051952 TaxID=3154851 RepID=UPI003446A8BB